MILDFKEIPVANQGGGLQDTFELFTRDFLQYLGYRIICDPDRGPDGKKDMIVEEVIEGIASEYSIRWLVSCKHFAHSGNAVKDSDEINISERLRQHECQGFMGVYSTLPAVTLSGVLAGIKYTTVFDREKIEGLLLRDAEGQRLASRYFPVSYFNFRVENPVPDVLYSNTEPICCEICGANLLEGSKHGIYITFTVSQEIDDEGNFITNDKQVKEIHFTCKGLCDRRLCDEYKTEFDSQWGEIDDLKNPTIWIQRLMAFFNGIFSDQDLSEEAFKTMKQMFIRTYPYVARHMTSKEKERVSSLLKFGQFY